MPGAAAEIASAGIPARLKTLAAREALTWLRKVAGVEFADKEKDRAEILAAEEYDMAVYVSRIVVAEKAREMLRAVGAAVRTGDIPARFDRAERLGKIITTGLQQYDPRIAFQASLRSAYSAGRYERAMTPEVVDEEPYFIYRTLRDSRVRNSHKVLNGVALPKADPWWNTHYPPNGWRCRCKAYSLDDAGLGKLERAGVPVLREAPEEAMIEHKNKVTGEVETLPASVEPGWGFIPGSADGAVQMQKLLDRRMVMLQTEQF